MRYNLTIVKKVINSSEKERQTDQSSDEIVVFVEESVESLAVENVLFSHQLRVFKSLHVLYLVAILPSCHNYTSRLGFLDDRGTHRQTRLLYYVLSLQIQTLSHHPLLEKVLHLDLRTHTVLLSHFSLVFDVLLAVHPIFANHLQYLPPFPLRVVRISHVGFGVWRRSLDNLCLQLCKREGKKRLNMLFRVAFLSIDNNMVVCFLFDGFYHPWLRYILFPFVCFWFFLLIDIVGLWAFRFSDLILPRNQLRVRLQHNLDRFILLGIPLAEDTPLIFDAGCNERWVFLNFLQQFALPLEDHVPQSHSHPVGALIEQLDFDILGEGVFLNLDNFVIVWGFKCQTGFADVVLVWVFEGQIDFVCVVAPDIQIVDSRGSPKFDGEDEKVLNVGHQPLFGCF